ncbi:MAG: hypothetical protein JW827_04830 [Spirochaetes bacterium]|nr:hypothetical protein [Spirochaetota bacterium]
MGRKGIYYLMIILLGVSSLEAAFKEGNNWNARATGMGGAFTAIADDASAPVYNPAGMAQIDRVQAIFNFSKPYLGVEEVDFNYAYLSLTFPMEDVGHIGIGWNNFNATSIYEEYSFLLSYSTSMDRVFSPKFKYLYTGLNIKYLYHGFQLDQRTIDDPVFSGGKGKGNIGVDIGFLAKRLFKGLPHLDLALAVNNINEPDIGLGQNDPIYREFKFGLSYLLPGSVKTKNDYIFSMDTCYRNEELNIKGGVEGYFFNRFLIARLGANFNEMTAGLGINYSLKNKVLFQFNYAFLYPMGIRGSYGTHQMSVNIRI